MTDMRATERLLEVIEERCEAIERGWRDGYKINVDEFRGLVEFVVETKHEIAELRRRGDTLVRRDDLRNVLAAARTGLDEASFQEDGSYSGEADAIASGYRSLERLENAIGGKP